MSRADKEAAVATLADEFRNSNGAVLTDYRGLSVDDLKQLRRALGDNATYAIVKNTLTKLAAKDAGIEGIDDLLIKGGYLDGKAISADEIRQLADLESRDVLLAKLAGATQASLQNAVSL